MGENFRADKSIIDWLAGEFRRTYSQRGFNPSHQSLRTDAP
jgi:hypothetical protein